MSFSRLLLVAANSKKYISGEGNDKVVIKPSNSLSSKNHDPYAGEVILCFQLDDPKDKEKRVSRSLGIPESDKRCDGLIFYAQDENEHKAICLVEMKSTKIQDAAEQIKSTRDHIKTLLHQECSLDCGKELKHIRWKACFYHHGTSLDQTAAIRKQLKKDGFEDIDVFTHANNDVGPLLRSEVSAKEMAKKYRRDKRR